MGFWFAFLFWLGTSIVTALLTKPKIENARASGLDDFQVPTATEGRVVPLIAGKVKITGPNVVWYGDLTTIAIKESVGGFLGIGAKDVIKGYKYYIGVQMAVARGLITGHDRIWFGDKVIKSGEATGNVVFEDFEFFGGENSGGGTSFTLEFVPGSNVQAVNTYLAAQYTPTPAYLSTAMFVMSDGAGGPALIGNSANLRNFAFELYHYPNSLAATGGAERIGDDANPLCFLYEILVANTDYGLGMDPTEILLTGTAEDGNMRAVAEQVATEGLGFSIVIDREMEAKELIHEVERHVDGAFVLDVADGKYKFNLARPAIATPPTLDETNIVEMVNFARGNWATTKNEVRVGYNDRAKEYASTWALDQDLANREITTRRNTVQLNFPGIKSATVAADIAARELRGLSFPLAKCTLKLTRAQYELNRGKPFLWDWPDEGIVDLAMRVIKIRYGKDANGEITVDAVEDIWRLESAGFVAPPATGWVPPNFSAVSPLDARIWQTFIQLAPEGNSLVPVLLIARNGGLHTAYDAYTDFDGGTDNFVISLDNQSNWTPTAELQGAITEDLGDVNPYRSATITIDTLNDIDLGDLQAAASITVDETKPTNLILVDDEIMWFEGVVDNMDGSFDLTNVHRGAIGTIPRPHADNARVWFIGQGAGLLSETAFPTGAIRARAPTRTATGTQSLASAPNIPISADYTVVAAVPMAPRDVQVGGDKFVDLDGWTEQPGTLAITWKAWSANSAFALAHGAAHEGEDGGISYTVIVYRDDTDVAVITRAGIPLSINGGAFNAGGFLPITAAVWPAESPIPAELDFYIEVKARQLLVDSQVWLSRVFTIEGWGINYNENYGGLDDAGVVLAQGEPPIIVEPIPGVDIQRELHFTFSGIATAPDRFVVNVFFFGPDGVFNSDYVVDPTGGEDGAAMADILYGLLVAESDALFAPFVAISKVNDKVIVSSFSGSLGSRGAINDAGGNSSFTYQRPAAATGSALQAGFIDFWDSEPLPVSQGGGSHDVLAPSSGSEYANNASANLRLSVFALTYDAAVALNPGTNGRPFWVRDYGTFTGFNGAVGIRPYTDLLDDLVDGLNNSTVGVKEFTAGGNFGFGRYTDPADLTDGNNIAQSRTGITFLGAAEHAITLAGAGLGPDTARNVSNSSSGHALLVKQITSPRINRALEQIIEVTPLRTLDGDDLAAGQIFTLILDGTELNYTITGADVTLEGATSLYRDPVTEDWFANLPGGFTGTLLQTTRRDERSDGRGFFYRLLIRRDATNTPFTFELHAGYGARVKIEEF